VITTIDLNGELAKLRMFRDRTPQSTSADREGSGARLASYRGSAIFTSKFIGKTSWECHPEADEMVHILDGATTIDLAHGAEPTQSVALSTGMIIIIPQGAWHRFHSPDGVTLTSVTPQPSEFVRQDVDDPRKVERETSLTTQA
jgi:mannose-6-phosphate isomerase-like protein (cupin superfamily)